MSSSSLSVALSDAASYVNGLVMSVDGGFVSQ